MSTLSKVFEIEELKGMILQNLPMSALLLPRVCKGWHNTISSSTEFQRKLYCEPAIGEPLILFRYNVPSEQYDANRSYNLKVRRPHEEVVCRLADTGELLARQRWVWAPQNNPLAPVEVVENPIVHNFAKLVDGAVKEDVAPSLPEAWARPEASWRRMWLCRPSVMTVAGVTLYSHHGSGYEEYRSACSDSKELRLGDLFDTLSKWDLGRTFASGLLKKDAYHTFSFDIIGAELWKGNTDWDWPEEIKTDGGEEDEEGDAEGRTD